MASLSRVTAKLQHFRSLLHVELEVVIGKGRRQREPAVTADFMDALPGKPDLAAVNFFTFYNGGAGMVRLCFIACSFQEHGDVLALL